MARTSAGAEASPEKSVESQFLGESPIIKELLQRAERFACRADKPILISGPIGAGKSLLAKIIHSLGNRRDKPLIFVDCGGLPDLENVLVGHTSGAFTGAVKPLPGRLKAADGGILVLDDVDRLSLHHQDLLHRILSEHRFFPVGSDQELRVDIRFIATTNKDLEKEAAEGRLKPDFVSRLEYLRLDVPGLDERLEDVPALCNLLLRRNLDDLEEKGIREPALPLEFNPDCWPLIQSISFRDNVRGLDKLVVKLIAHVEDRGVIMPCDIQYVAPALPPSDRIWFEAGRSLRSIREAAERDHILKIAQRCRFNYRQVARILEISPKALYERLKRYDIERE